MSGAAVRSARSLIDPRQLARASALLLFFALLLAWASPAHAQALSLNVGPTLNGAIGFNSFTLQASGGTPPYQYTLVTPVPGFRVQNGAPLPTNITIQPSGTGAFLGVATAFDTFPTTIRVTDAALTVVDRPVTLNIPKLQMSTNPPKATVGVPYSYTMQGFGGGGTYTWAATNMPPGLGIGSSGTISGTPTLAGVFNNPSPTITMTDASLVPPPPNTLARGNSITVDPFAITTSGPIIATAGVFYTQTLQAPGCGSPCTWSPTSLGGLSLNSSGVLSGTGFAQTGTITATASGPNGTVSKLLAVFVSSPSTALSSGFLGFGDQTVGNFITSSVLPFGGTPPYTVSLVGGALPPGISLQPGAGLCTSNCAEGITYLAGRAMEAGTFTFTLQFQDSAAHTFTPAPYNWRISPLNSQYFNLPLTGTISVGTPYSQKVLVAGGSNSYTFTLVTPLPPGLSIDLNTGIISGTPTQSGSVNTQILITDATDANVKIAANFNLSVMGPPAVVTLPATNVGSAGAPFSARLNGTYNPGGFSTTANFQWGTTIAYGNTAGSSSASGLNSQTIGFDLTGLSCAAVTVFHYRLVATNSQGTTQGVDQTFTCAPTVSTSNPFDVTAFTATLNGGVNPNGLATTAFYQWGLTSSYTNSTPVQSVGAGTTQVFIDGGTISGLSCGTVYHFRATATNASGTSVGNDVTFSTSTCSPGAFTGVAMLVGQTNATLFGGANPNGTATTAHFEWGLTTSYGNSTGNQSMGSGIDPVPMSGAAISGLTCNTTYHFRTVATNSFGPTSASDRAFVTAPCVTSTFRSIVYSLTGYPFTNLIYAYGVKANGALEQLPGFPVSTGGAGETEEAPPEQLTYDAAKGRLYAINVLSNTLSVFSVNARTGALTAMPFSPIALPTGFWTSVRVHPSGSPVTVGSVADESFTNGSVASYTITPTTATLAAGSPQTTGVPVYSSAFSRDGNYLYVGAGSGNPTGPSTAAYSVNTSNGVLTPLGGSPFTLGGLFPIGYATDDSGRLFAANNEGHEVRAFTTAGGVPTAVSGNPFPSGSDHGIAGVLHPAGFYMVGNEDTTGGVSVYRIAGAGSATTLTAVAGSPFSTGGQDASNLVLSKDGRYLIAVNGSTRNLTIFSIDSGTGGLTTVSVQAPGTLGNIGFANSIALVTSTSSPDGDYDGDGKADIDLYRPSTGTWYIKQSGANYSTYQSQAWGLSTDVPVPGDYDGDGKADFALYRPSTGVWYILQSSTNYTTYAAPTWGLSTDVPVPGDYDGDGKVDPALYRPSTGVWYVLLSSTNYATYMAQTWGVSTDVPVSGDYDGDGKADFALYRPSTGVWYILQSSTNYTTYAAPTWGLSTDITVPGDYDGDGKVDPAVYRPSTGTWYLLKSSTNYTTYVAQAWGLSTDIAVPGDYDGDGRTDLGQYRPSTGDWYVLTSGSNYTTYIGQNWGFGTDTPLLRRR